MVARGYGTNDSRDTLMLPRLCLILLLMTQLVHDTHLMRS